MNKSPKADLNSSSDFLTEEEAALQAGVALKMLSHFIKNILQMVGGGAEMAELALRNNNLLGLQKSLSLVMPNLDRLKRVILDLCEYSRIRPLEPAACDLNQILRQAVRDLPPAMKENIARLTLQTDPAIPAARLDADKVRQIIRHFLFHLLDPEQGHNGPVTVETRYLPESEEFLIAFAAPIPLPEDPRTLFQPAEYKITKFRSGLDLPLAKRLVDLHQGRIELDTRPDGQTVFTICLPQKMD
jgi:two-component system sensor histidine kinase HydH